MKWLIWKSVSPEDVLKQLTEWIEIYRSVLPPEIANEFLDKEIAFSTPMDEFFKVLDFIDPDARTIFCFWGVENFHSLEFETTGDFCHHIARHSKKIVFLPWRVLGQRCWAGGVFLTLQALLVHISGGRYADVTPTTHLETIEPDVMARLLYVVQRSLPHSNSLDFICALSITRVGKVLAASGALLYLTVAAYMLDDWFGWGVGAQIPILIELEIPGLIKMVGFNVLWILAGCLLLTGVWMRGPAKWVRVEQVSTFRDLAKQIARRLPA